jgi:hypothetical protein
MTDHPMPDPPECLPCFIDRMLDEVGCNNHLSLAARYRDLHAPDDIGLERRLADLGGYCDCEVLANAYQPHRRLPTRLIDLPGDPDGGAREPVPVVVLPPCSGVPEGSTEPCDLWEPVHRGGW